MRFAKFSTTGSKRKILKLMADGYTLAWVSMWADRNKEYELNKAGCDKVYVVTDVVLEMLQDGAIAINSQDICSIGDN